MSTVRLSLALVEAIVVSAVIPAASPAHSVGAKRCHTWAYYPNVLISKAKHMTCYRAKRDMRRYKRPIRYRFTTPGGFHCKRVSGMRLSGTWRCGRDGKAFRFRFAD